MVRRAHGSLTADNRPAADPSVTLTVMLTGLLIAALACLGSGLGSALEAFGVHRAAARTGGSADLGPLLRTPQYVAGLSVDVLGSVCTVIALQYLPLFLVQAVVAASVGVTAVVMAVTGRPVGRRAWIALGASLIGLALLASSAEPDNGPMLDTVWQWLLLASALPLTGLGLAVERRPHRAAPALFGLLAGVSFSVVSISARGLDLPEPPWLLVRMPSAWAIAVLGILGTVFFARGLQHGRVTVVAAVTFTTETVLPATVGLLFLGDEIRPGREPLAVVGFGIAVVAAMFLARFAAPGLSPGPAHRTAVGEPTGQPDGPKRSTRNAAAGSPPSTSN